MKIKIALATLIVALVSAFFQVYYGEQQSATENKPSGSQSMLNVLVSELGGVLKVVEAHASKEQNKNMASEEYIKTSIARNDVDSIVAAIIKYGTAKEELLQYIANEIRVLHVGNLKCIKNKSQSDIYNKAIQETILSRKRVIKVLSTALYECGAPEEFYAYAL